MIKLVKYAFCDYQIQAKDGSLKKMFSDNADESIEKTFVKRLKENIKICQGSYMI